MTFEKEDSGIDVVGIEVGGDIPGPAGDTAKDSKKTDGGSNKDIDEFYKNAAIAGKKHEVILDEIAGIRGQFRKTFPDDFLVLNDITLEGVPTTAIRIQAEADMFVGETLRTTAPVIDTKGRSDTTVTISLAFNEGEQQIKLRRLVGELMYHPFVFMENNRIRQAAKLSTNDTMVFVLESGTLRVDKEAVGTIFLDLFLHSFNYRPFSNHFWYNFLMPGEQTKGQRKAHKNPNLDLGNLRGFDSTAFSAGKFEELTEQAIFENTPIIEGKIVDQYNRATLYPSESAPWMRYADSMVDLLSNIDSRTSDFIGFGYRAYQYIKPPEAARAGKGNLKNLLFGDYTFPDPPAEFDATKDGKGSGGTTESERHAKAVTDSGTTKATTLGAVGTAARPLQSFAEAMAQNKSNWETGGTLTNKEMAADVCSTTSRGNDAVFAVKDVKGYAGFSKCNLFAFELLRRAGYRVPILPKANAKGATHGWSYPQPKKITQASAGNDLKNWGIRRTGLSKGELQKIISKGIPLVITHRSHIVIATDILSVDVDSTTQFVRSISFKCYDNQWAYKKGSGAPRRSSFTFFREGHKSQKWIEIIQPLPAQGVGDIYWNYGGKPAPSKSDSLSGRRNLYVNLMGSSSDKQRGRTLINNLRNAGTELKKGLLVIGQYAGIVRSAKVDEKELVAMNEQDVDQYGDSVSAQKYAGPDVVPTPVYRNFETRQLWIAKTEKDYDVKYYEGSDVRNIFYREKEFGIISEPGIGEPNITCSALSITFGHRLAPQKILGQEGCTWQFLGAGNKMGTMVFSFAGEQGRASARKIKEMFDDLQANARMFSFIKGGSSAKLYSDPLLMSNISAKVPKNNILALSNIKDIVISEIDDSTDSEAVDKHQIVVNFLAQEFMEEKYRQRDLIKMNYKKQIIQKICEYIDRKEYKPKAHEMEETMRMLKKHSPYVYEKIKAEEKVLEESIQWIVPKRAMTENAPQWFVDIVLKAVDICEETDNEISLTSCKVAHSGNRILWEQVYNQWGAKNIIRGQAKGFDTAEVFETHTSEGRPIFEDDGESRKHARIFRLWLDKMNTLVNKVIEHLSDAEGFDDLFKQIANSLIDDVTRDVGSCYEDLRLPTRPGGKIPLPPEFYIYDDSAENGLLAGGHDEKVMEIFLDKIIDNDLKSLRKILKDSYLGGFYISQNAKKILEDRKGIPNELYRAEFGFHEGMRMNVIAKQLWDPTFYDESESEETYTGWLKNVVAEGFGENPKEGYFNNIIKITPYLEQGHNSWFGGEKDSREKYVGILRESIYGKEWKETSFGPNKDYSKVDEVWSGKLSKPDIEEEVPKEVVKINTSDGAAVKGTLDEEELPGPTELFMKAKTGKGDPVAEYQRGLRKVVRKLQEAPSYEEQEDEKEHIKKLAIATGIGTKAKDISMRRAYPTFKIYFIEDDQDQDDMFGSKHRRAFDDFYSYSAIQEIKVIRSRKVAANLATIRMTNVAGIIHKKRFGEKDVQYDKYGQEVDETRKAEYATGIASGTEKEHPFAKMVLKEGVKVQIRLGYSSDPDLLESVFLGQIIEVAPSEDNRILEIVCQGYGAELEGTILGPLESGDSFYSSQHALSAAVLQENVVNFGRRRRSALYNAAEVRHWLTGGDSRTDEMLPFWNPWKMFLRSERGKEEIDWHYKLRKYEFLNEPQDDNIFAPPPALYTTFWGKQWNNACYYRPIQQTSWEIFKEHELRHPGYVSLPVPYGHSARMTMFFGSKGQNYWCKPPSNLETFLATTYSSQIKKLAGGGMAELSRDRNFITNFKKTFAQRPQLADALLEDISNLNSKQVGFWLGRKFGRFRPFRNYHIFTSDYHIIKNNIRTSINGTYNEVEVLYSESEGGLDTDKVTSVQQGQDGILAMKLDDNIPAERIRSYSEDFPSCVTDLMAKRYAQGLLMRHLRDSYQGDIIVLGEETLRPYDIISLNDNVTDMYGPIEVEQVIHIFNRDFGFISIVTPDLVVDANEYISQSTMNATMMTLAAMWNDMDTNVKLATAGGTAILGPVGIIPLGLLGAFGAVKFMQIMQDATPVIVTPLILGGKPFVSTTTPTEMTGIWSSFGGKWHCFWDDTAIGWDKLDIGEEFFDFNIGIKEWYSDLIGVKSKMEEAKR